MMHAGATVKHTKPRHRLEAPQSESLAATTDNNIFPDCLTLLCDLPNSNYLYLVQGKKNCIVALL